MKSLIAKIKRYFFYFTKKIRVSRDSLETISSIEENFLINPLSKKVALVAHFDPDGIFDETFLNYIEQIRISGFCVIVISTSSLRSKSCLKRVLSLCCSVIFRDNIGLDFASWSSALLMYNLLESADELLFLNDSIIPLSQSVCLMIKKLQTSNSNFCGLVESFEKERHFQSYFILIKSAAWENIKLYKFLHNIRAFSNKKLIISLYEIGLSQLIFREGISHEALVSYESLTQNLDNDFEFSNELKRKKLNPSLHMWKELFLHYEIPFIKREMLTTNAIKSVKIMQWEKVLNIKNENRRLILDYVNRYKESLRV